jgi:hypothetical protein
MLHKLPILAIVIVIKSALSAQFKLREEYFMWFWRWKGKMMRLQRQDGNMMRLRRQM